MHPSLRCCSARAHQPLIKFIGKRTFPSTQHAPHPHPAAPSELKQRFAEFLKKFNSPVGASTIASSSSSLSSIKPQPGVAVYDDFWEAPSRVWKPRVRQLEEEEINAVMSGGASVY